MPILALKIQKRQNLPTRNPRTEEKRMAMTMMMQDRKKLPDRDERVSACVFVSSWEQIGFTTEYGKGH